MQHKNSDLETEQQSYVDRDQYYTITSNKNQLTARQNVAKIYLSVTNNNDQVDTVCINATAQIKPSHSPGGANEHPI